MKKGKTSNNRDLQERKPSRDEDIFSDGDGDDDEIIDLEDIVELGLVEKGKGRHAEDEIILDADGDLDLNALDAELDERDENALEADLLKEFGFEEDLESAPFLKKDKTAPPGEAVRGISAEDSAPRPSRGEKGIDSDLDFLLKDEEENDSQRLVERQRDAGKPPGEAAGKPAVPVADKPLTPPPEAGFVPQTTTGSPDVDRLIDELEERLLQAIREIVEAKLPGVVRSLLREELENLRKDMEKER